jgi:hypothetical protein
MASQEQRFSLVVVDDHIELKTWGQLDVDDLDAPANAALVMAQTKHIDKLLDDIRQVDTAGATIPVQVKAMGILWTLRSFKKVAILFEGTTTRTLFFSTLKELHLNLNPKFRGFDDEAEALAWLNEE